MDYDFKPIGGKDNMKISGDGLKKKLSTLLAGHLSFTLTLQGRKTNEQEFNINTLKSHDKNN